MRSILRAGLAAVALLATTTTPASAQGVAVLTCRVTYRLGSFTTGTGTCQVTGEVDGSISVLSGASMTFSVQPGTLPNCLDDRGTGSMSGALNLTFAWTRFGEAGLFTTAGDINGGGAGTFTEVAGIQDRNITCGMVTTQAVTMVLAGP